MPSTKQFRYWLAPLFFTGILGAQTVAAHFAQHLVMETMSAHPELQKLGLHAIAPGDQDDTIIACNIPSKISKKSSPADLEVEQTGKPSVKTVTQGSFYDMALPLSDAAHQRIGLMVAEMRFEGASSADDALAKIMAIRDTLQQQIPDLASLFKKAPKSDPLVLLKTTKLPEIVGDFDHFAVNVKQNRLYVSAEVHHSIEVFDLQTGDHLQSVPGVTTPHTIAYVPETNQLLVADGGDGSCRILDAGDFRQIKRIPLEPGPDAAYYDPSKRIFYVANGGRAAELPYSYLTAISVDKQDIVSKVRIESTNLEAMSLDSKTKTLYVNMRDKQRVAVVDLGEGRVKQLWPVPDMNLNTAMAFDSVHHRIFIAGRKPGKLFVLDSESGKCVATFPTIETADDMTFDEAHKNIYVTGSGGVSVFHQMSADRYEKVAEFGTNSGKTSVYVASLDRLYVIHTKTPEDIAALQIYQVNAEEQE